MLADKPPAAELRKCFMYVKKCLRQKTKCKVNMFFNLLEQAGQFHAIGKSKKRKKVHCPELKSRFKIKEPSPNSD